MKKTKHTPTSIDDPCLVWNPVALMPDKPAAFWLGSNAQEYARRARRFGYSAHIEHRLGIARPFRVVRLSLRNR